MMPGSWARSARRSTLTMPACAPSRPDCRCCGLPTPVSRSASPLGRIVAQLAENQIGVLDVVPSEPLPGGTIFNRIGDLPFWLAVGLGIFGSLIAARRPRRVA